MSSRSEEVGDEEQLSVPFRTDLYYSYATYSLIGVADERLRLRLNLLLIMANRCTQFMQQVLFGQGLVEVVFALSLCLACCGDA